MKFQHESEAAKSARLAKRRKRAEEVPEKQRNVALAHAKERIAQSRASREKCWSGIMFDVRYSRTSMKVEQVGKTSNSSIGFWSNN